MNFKNNDTNYSLIENTGSPFNRYDLNLLDLMIERTNYDPLQQLLEANNVSFGLGASPGLGAVNCFGSSYSPFLAEKILKEELPKLRNAAATVFNVEIEHFARAVNRWIDVFYGLQTYERNWLRYDFSNPPEGCSKDGLEIIITALDKEKNQLLSQMKDKALEKGGRLVLDRTEPVSYRYKKNTIEIATLRHPAVERYKIVIDKPVIVEPIPVFQQPLAPISQPQPIPEEIQPTIVNSLPSPEPTKSSSIPIFAILGTAALTYFLIK